MPSRYTLNAIFHINTNHEEVWPCFGKPLGLAFKVATVGLVWC